MHDIRQRARLRPGPLFATAFAGIVLATTVLRAHDPGLSSLDVNVGGRVISASLAIAGADVALVTAGPETSSQRLRELARDAIRVTLDGDTLSADDVQVAIDAEGARIGLTFPIPRARDRFRTLSITSDLPGRLARGHRELLVVSIDGRVSADRVLDAQSGSVSVDLEAASPALGRAWSFLVVGVGHILAGYDHLAFLAGLLLAARKARELVMTLTAFTAAHTVSLALVVFGGFHAPASIVEPLIAASIAWIGVQTARRGLKSQASSRTTPIWIVFGVGLVHGLGFAEALMDLGFGSSPARAAVALFSFNAGVEAGQLAVAAALLPLVRAIRSRPALEARLIPACSVVIAVAGGWWLLSRLVAGD